MLKPVRKVYQENINTDEGGPRHAITTPRDYKQVMEIIRILKAYYNREPYIVSYLWILVPFIRC